MPVPRRHPWTVLRRKRDWCVPFLRTVCPVNVWPEEGGARRRARGTPDGGTHRRAEATASRPGEDLFTHSKLRLYMLSTSLPRLLPHECWEDWAPSLCRWRASALPVPARSRQARGSHWANWAGLPSAAGCAAPGSRARRRAPWWRRCSAGWPSSWRQLLRVRVRVSLG